MKTTKTGRIYGRFSSKPQERGDSKRRQIEGAKAYAAKNGITIVAEPYFDEGVSGKAGLNLEKEFGRLLQEANEGEIILCEALDRIGRQNPFILGKLIYDLVAKGLTLTAWQEGKTIDKTNIETLETQFSVFTGAAVGHADNTRKINRIRETTTNAIKEAVAGNQSRALLKFLPQCFEWDETSKDIVINTSIATIIKRIFKMYNDGIGKTTICRTLNAENVPTLYNIGLQTIGSRKPWMETSITKVLKNESYAGRMHCKGNLITCIPKVITPALFDSTQLLLQRNSTKAGKLTGRANNLFNGLAVCKHCGGTVNVSVAQPKKAGNKTCYSYRCRNARLNQCTSHNMLNADDVEYLFCMFFFMADPSKAANNDSSALVAKIKVAEDKLTKIKAAISNLYDMAEQGDTEAKDRIANRKLEQQKLEQELTTLKGETIEYSKLPSVVTGITEALKGDGIVIDASELKTRLNDNAVRLQLRNNLPSMFDKVVIDTTARTVEGILKDGVKLNTFFKDITKFSVPRKAHSKDKTAK